MLYLFGALSNVVGLLGIVICLVAGIFRISGSFYVGGYEALTLFTAGVGVMVFSCLLKLEVLLRSR